VLVKNYRTNVVLRAGLGLAALHEVNPRLLYAQLSGLGYDGPGTGRGGFEPRASRQPALQRMLYS